MSVYVPSAAIVMLSWLSFFMEPSNIADRLALEITMILTIVFLLDGINKSIIHVSYAKASDVFVIVSFCFIFLALFETMLVYRLSFLCQEKKKRKCSTTVSMLIILSFDELFVLVKATSQPILRNLLKNFVS